MKSTHPNVPIQTTLDNEAVVACTYCGQQQTVPRINRNYLIQQLLGILSFEKGFFFTVKQMLIRPGTSVRDFIAGNRKLYMKPVLFLILCTLIYTVIDILFPFELKMYSEMGINEKHPSYKFNMFIREHHNLTNIVNAIFIALWVNIFFRKSSSYNFYEIVVLVCFYTGITILFSGILGFIAYCSGFYQTTLLIIISMVYGIWVVSKFFQIRKIGGFLKVIVALLLGTFSFGFLIGIASLVVLVIENQT